MSGYSDLIALLKQQQEDRKTLRLLEEKGYANPQADNFGINQWTSCLLPRTRKDDDPQLAASVQPEHLVSFLSIPVGLPADCIDTNRKELHDWISGYQWQFISSVNSPYPQARIRACSEGILLPKWVETSDQSLIEAFLLIRGDGIFEAGNGRNVYSIYDEGSVFQFIQIVGLLWQFLVFIKDFYRANIPGKNLDTLIILNMRGIKEALLGDLAEGWRDPLWPPYDSFRPKCPDKHLQIRRMISMETLENGIPDVLRWFATRIDNAWGQFEPRCYVRRDLDETQPFARKTR